MRLVRTRDERTRRVARHVLQQAATKPYLGGQGAPNAYTELRVAEQGVLFYRSIASMIEFPRRLKDPKPLEAGPLWTPASETYAERFAEQMANLAAAASE